MPCTKIVGAKLAPRFAPDAYRFPVVSSTGAALAEGAVSPTDLANARSTLRRWTRATALAVLALTLLLCTGPLIDIRRSTASTQRYLAATTGLLALLLAAYGLLSSATMTLFDWT